MSKPKPEITAYLKTWCGWSEGIRAMLRKYELEFEEKDIIKNPAFRWEMEQRSGQQLSPCVMVNGTMLPDISGDEVESYLLSNDLVDPASSERAIDLFLPHLHNSPKALDLKGYFHQIAHLNLRNQALQRRRRMPTPTAPSSRRRRSATNSKWPRQRR